MALQVPQGREAFFVQNPHLGCSILGPKELIETRGPKAGSRRDVITSDVLGVCEDFAEIWSKPRRVENQYEKIGVMDMFDQFDPM